MNYQMINYNIVNFLSKFVLFGKSFRKDIYSQIGVFYYNKYKERRTVSEAIKMLMIESVWYDYRKNQLHILLGRPGLLIGSKGENIDGLLAFLKESWKYKFPINRIIVHEDREKTNLFNYEYFYSDDSTF